MDEYTAVEMAYKNGYETALKDIAKIICEKCGYGCPFKIGCNVYSDEACITRIIEGFMENIKNG